MLKCEARTSNPQLRGEQILGRAASDLSRALQGIRGFRELILEFHSESEF